MTNQSATGVPGGDQDERAFDASKPTIARVYDYWLGGRDNFAVDRAVAARMLWYDPELEQRVRDNRKFVTEVAVRAAAEGIVQFIDLGAGLPAYPSLHQAARTVSPLARVVYIDNDPMVVSHAQALLAKGDGLAVTDADLCNPVDVLADPVLRGVIDLTQPVCVMLAAVAHFLPAAQVAELAARYMEPLAAGSWLAVSVAHYDDEELLSKLFPLHPTAPFRNHGAAEMASFLGGLDLLPPGIGEAGRWLAGLPGTTPGRPAYMLCGVGVKRPSEPL